MTALTAITALTPRTTLPALPTGLPVPRRTSPADTYGSVTRIQFAPVDNADGPALTPPDAIDEPQTPLAERPFAAAELYPSLTWFFTKYTPVPAPARQAEIITASLAGLATIDPSLSVVRRGTQVVVSQGDRVLDRFPAPINVGTWGKAAERVHKAFAEASPEYRAAGDARAFDGFFSGLTRKLDGFSWYKNAAQAAAFQNLMHSTTDTGEISTSVVDGVGVIRIRRFTDASYTTVKNALEGWKLLAPASRPDAPVTAPLEPAVSGLVIDLIDDGGGVTTSSRLIADTLLRRGVLFTERGNDPADTEHHEADAEGIPETIPVTVLVNGATASAAELLALSLQENRRAVVYGTSSFGKGKEQTTMPMPGGGLLALTTAYVYGPSGVSDDGQGVTPNACSTSSGISMDAATRSELRRDGEFDASPENPIRAFCPPLPTRAEVRTPGRRPMSDDDHAKLTREAIALMRDSDRYNALLNAVELAPQPSVVLPRNSAFPGLPWWAGPK